MGYNVKLHAGEDFQELRSAFLALLDALDELPEVERGIKALRLGASLVEAAGLNLMTTLSHTRVAMLLLTSAKLAQTAGEIGEDPTLDQPSVMPSDAAA